MLTGECLAWPSSETFPPAVDGNKYRYPQLHNVQRVRDLGTLSPQQDVSIKSPQGIENLMEEEA